MTAPPLEGSSNGHTGRDEGEVSSTACFSFDTAKEPEHDANVYGD